MLAFSFASVPLYRIFCQKTGFGGMPQIGRTSTGEVLDQVVTIQFVGNVSRDLPWEFYPLQNEVKIRIGESAITTYRATNTSNEPIVGMATYNVSPDQSGLYFNKIHCFCFEQQKLEPGQSMNMPVLFFLDPDFARDPNTQHIKTITLSYTFFRYKAGRFPGL